MEKRAAILDAAQDLFTDQGFEHTSMDAVASRAGVSKLTVYSHFGDKATLFREAVRARCQAMVPEQLYGMQDGDTLREALLRIARHHAKLMSSPETIGVWRAITSDCASGGPRLGQMLWEEGPMRSRQLMTTLLQERVDHGELVIDDVDRAAGQFLTLLKGDLHFRRLLGCVDDRCPQFREEMDANAEAAVDMFLRAYEPR
ncbi:TetR/AcrR family transcriptional regulator [Oleiagrimonas soli]|nr:TetR/AcrR family transcriptional regulator [Oleiagrimonas soli]MBB6185128.1 AcrR family transcriptional regulator [Oleiagrimonas soli]